MWYVQVYSVHSMTLAYARQISICIFARLGLEQMFMQALDT